MLHWLWIVVCMAVGAWLAHRRILVYVGPTLLVAVLVHVVDPVLGRVTIGLVTTVGVLWGLGWEVNAWRLRRERRWIIDQLVESSAALRRDLD